MAGEKRGEEVVVDTYALLAIIYDEVSDRARAVLNGVRQGSVTGLVPVTVAYEYVVHWLRGRVPAFRSLGEVETYLKAYFKIVELSFYDYVRAADVKVRGDRALRESGNLELRTRSLSVVDSTVLALALRLGVPIVTGDRDLMYVAELEGVEVIW